MGWTITNMVLKWFKGHCMYKLVCMYISPICTYSVRPIYFSLCSLYVLCVYLLVLTWYFFYYTHRCMLKAENLPAKLERHSSSSGRRAQLLQTSLSFKH